MPVVIHQSFEVDPQRLWAFKFPSRLDYSEGDSFSARLIHARNSVSDRRRLGSGHHGLYTYEKILHFKGDEIGGVNGMGGFKV